MQIILPQDNYHEFDRETFIILKKKIEMNHPFGGIYNGKKVLVTGHTGFKGSWLSLWLSILGADVYGYALPPHTNPSLFDLLKLKTIVKHQEADICDLKRFKETLKSVKPDIIFHLAAQSLVRHSYDEPLDTVMVNTIGTVNILEAIRQSKLPAAVILVTTDKCYENKEWLFGYRENDPMGGFDPYSSSKGAAEILISSWRNSFFSPYHIKDHGVRVASVRAGNVIGGGDWSKDRIVPDCIRDLQQAGVIQVRNPHATRPWQHVLEPLSGYLQLGAKLLDLNDDQVSTYCEAFNFGPLIHSNKNVSTLVEKIINVWGHGSWKTFSPEKIGHEASLLNLTIDKAYHKLNWLPKWNFDETVKNTVAWYKNAQDNPTSIFDYTSDQIQRYQNKLNEHSTTLSDVTPK